VGRKLSSITTFLIREKSRQIAIKGERGRHHLSQPKREERKYSENSYGYGAYEKGGENNSA